MQPLILVALGGAIGASARYGASIAIGHLWRTPFPLATLLVNIIGSLAMGLLVGWLARALPAWQNEARLFVAVGILGGFTTFSTFSLDVVTLFQRGEMLPAFLYILASVILCVVALFVGLLLIRVLPA
jgi:fluoride exporter